MCATFEQTVRLLFLIHYIFITNCHEQFLQILTRNVLFSFRIRRQSWKTKISVRKIQVRRAVFKSTNCLRKICCRCYRPNNFHNLRQILAVLALSLCQADIFFLQKSITDIISSQKVNIHMQNRHTKQVTDFKIFSHQVMDNTINQGFFNVLNLPDWLCGKLLLLCAEIIVLKFIKL